MTTIYAYTKDSQAYVGKTMNPQNRIYTHKKRFGEWNYKELDVIPSVKKEDYKPYECAWIQIYTEWGYEMLNKNKGGGGPQGWRTEADIQQHDKEYYLNNKADRNKYHNQYYLDNKEKIKEQNYKYNKNRPPHVEANKKAYMKKYNYKRNHPQA